MNLYVESGFVLTLALRQDDPAPAERLLELARQRFLTLKIPAFSLSEPFATIRSRGNSRNRLIEELRREIRELGRTRHAQLAHALDQYTDRMANVLQEQADALDAIVLDLARTCEILALSSDVVAAAAEYKSRLTLRLPDAIVLASVIHDLTRAPGADESLFISQNSRDFAQAAIQDELRRLNCSYLADFANAVRLAERPSR
ncbi:MAG TPA: hypothetical protein VFA70_15070 [Dehalococcoidia bacterium]|jgi:predicted nucleic acid-binding protein|nr:hypothetical protein [Dehalococcoidia bacterium]